MSHRLSRNAVNGQVLYPHSTPSNRSSHKTEILGGVAGSRHTWHRKMWWRVMTPCETVLCATPPSTVCFFAFLCSDEPDLRANIWQLILKVRALFGIIFEQRGCFGWGATILLPQFFRNAETKNVVKAVYLDVWQMHSVDVNPKTSTAPCISYAETELDCCF